MKRQRKQPPAERADATADPAHAPGKRHLRPPAREAHELRDVPTPRMHDQPWVPTSGLIGRRRRSARRS